MKLEACVSRNSWSPKSTLVLPVRKTCPPLFFLYLHSSCLKASSNSFSEGQLGLKTSARLAMQELMSGSVEKMV